MSIQVASAPPAEQEFGDSSRLRPPVVLAAAMGLACLPLLASHAQLLWEKPHYQFFPWALLGAAVLAWRRREQMRSPVAGSPIVAYSLLGLGGFFLALAGYLVSPWLGMVASLIAATGFVWLLGGRRLFAALAPSLVLLLILVPPPLGLDTRLVLFLQGSTTNLASRTLDRIDLTHVPFAHTLEVPGEQLLVDEACSGIASLFSVVAFTLFFCLFLRRNWIHLLALVLFAIVFVVLGNVVRVVAITDLKSRHGIDLVNGWKHEATGLVVFAACLLLTASMDQAILFFTDAVRFFSRRRSAKVAYVANAAEPAAVAVEEEPATEASLSYRGASCLGGVFALVGLLSIYNVWIQPHGLRGDPTGRTLNVATIQQKMDTEALPKQIGAWERTHYERQTRSSGDPIGHYSDVWRYRRGKFEVVVQVDYPFRGGHDLTLCYNGRGWREAATAFPVLKGDVGESSTTAMIDLERSAVEKGYLWFSELDERGPWLAADDLHRSSGMNRLAARFGTETNMTVQVQMLLTTSAALDNDSRAEAQQLFAEARLLLRDRLFATGKEQP